MKKVLWLLIISIWLTGCSRSSEPPTPTEDVFYAPDFTLSSLNGDLITLSQLRGQWVLINFWATWCKPCVAEMPALQQLAVHFADTLMVLGINMRESEAEMRPFLAEAGVQYPILLNPDDATLINYQAMSLPQTLLVDPEGIIVWRQFGAIELASFEQELRALMGYERIRALQ